ncbi:MAG: hypothetical protein WD066_06865 [Planctomycetaceae bacterium]
MLLPRPRPSRPRPSPAVVWISACALAIAFAGCGERAESRSASDVADAADSATEPDQSPGDAAVAQSNSPPPRSFQPIRLDDAGNGTESNSAKPDVPTDPAARAELVRKKLQPLQVLVGIWEGKVFRQLRDVNAVDEPRWKWDLSQKGQPALLMESPKNAYITKARLTYLPDGDKFRLETTPADGETKRVFEGNYAAPVREEFVEGEDKPQRKFELQLNEVDADERDTWQVSFDQQRNDRYLMKLFKQRPSTGEFDMAINTLAMQRLGTSFAQSDSDYGDRTCVISEGLGTIQLSYAGKTYWVCCTGCQAAFNDDPAGWIAKAEERAKKK